MTDRMNLFMSYVDDSGSNPPNTDALRSAETTLREKKAKVVEIQSLQFNWPGGVFSPASWRAELIAAQRAETVANTTFTLALKNVTINTANSTYSQLQKSTTTLERRNNLIRKANQLATEYFPYIATPRSDDLTTLTDKYSAFGLGTHNAELPADMSTNKMIDMFCQTNNTSSDLTLLNTCNRLMISQDHTKSVYKDMVNANTSKPVTTILTRDVSVIHASFGQIVRSSDRNNMYITCHTFTSNEFTVFVRSTNTDTTVEVIPHSSVQDPYNIAALSKTEQVKFVLGIHEDFLYLTTVGSKDIVTYDMKKRTYALIRSSVNFDRWSGSFGFDKGYIVGEVFVTKASSSCQLLMIGIQNSQSWTLHPTRGNFIDIHVEGERKSWSCVHTTTANVREYLSYMPSSIVGRYFTSESTKNDFYSIANNSSIYRVDKYVVVVEHDTKKIKLYTYNNLVFTFVSLLIFPTNVLKISKPVFSDGVVSCLAVFAPSKQNTIMSVGEFIYVENSIFGLTYVSLPDLVLKDMKGRTGKIDVNLHSGNRSLVFVDLGGKIHQHFSLPHSSLVTSFRRQSSTTRSLKMFNDGLITLTPKDQSWTMDNGVSDRTSDTSNHIEYDSKDGVPDYFVSPNSFYALESSSGKLLQIPINHPVLGTLCQQKELFDTCDNVINAYRLTMDPLIGEVKPNTSVGICFNDEALRVAQYRPKDYPGNNLSCFLNVCQPSAFPATSYAKDLITRRQQNCPKEVKNCIIWLKDSLVKDDARIYTCSEKNEGFDIVKLVRENGVLIIVVVVVIIVSLIVLGLSRSRDNVRNRNR
jgi:hypothetical protein